MTQINKTEEFTFNGLGIEPKLLDIIRHLNFTVPTPIQLKSIPVIIEGKDMVGIAQTGTGKTLSFGIPTLQRLSKYGGRSLILVPTRELASQVNDHLKVIAQKLNLKTVVLIGGESKYPQIKSLQRKPELIIATPGRLIDHLESKNFNLNEIKSLILDEADLMFDMGFAPQLNKILKLAPKDKQTILFSATMPSAIMDIATKHMALPVRIEVAPAGTPAENVIQEVIILHKEDRTNQLAKVLSEYKGSVLIFVRTKSSVKNICRSISDMKHTVTEIHSNRTLAQRTRALKGFKEGHYRILVATDIAARGIDVKGIELVLNYDLPDNIEDYIHRIGRTGRAGKMGQAISFATPSQISAIRRIEKIIKKEIPLTKLVEVKNEGKDFSSRDNRSLGFQSSRGYRKTSRLNNNYRDKKWSEKGKSTYGRSGGYDKSNRTETKPETSQPRSGFNRLDGNNQTSDFNRFKNKSNSRSFNRYDNSRPSTGFSKTKPGGFNRYNKSENKPKDFNKYKQPQTSSDYRTKSDSSSSSERGKSDYKPNNFSKNKSHRPFEKRGPSKFKDKRNFRKSR